MGRSGLLVGVTRVDGRGEKPGLRRERSTSSFGKCKFTPNKTLLQSYSHSSDKMRSGKEE
jgi:hypothetical protein